MCDLPADATSDRRVVGTVVEAFEQQVAQAIGLAEALHSRVTSGLGGDVDSLVLWDRGSVAAPEVLRARVDETQRWCSLQLDAGVGPAMRSPELFVEVLHTGRTDVVCSVGRRRSRALWRDRTPPRTHAGRFLVYLPDQQLADGASEAASRGFFDVFDTPPCDTWVTWFEDGAYLLCWVPQRLESLVGQGIDVNPVECIRWLDATDLPAKAMLAGLHGQRRA